MVRAGAEIARSRNPQAAIRHAGTEMRICVAASLIGRGRRIARLVALPHHTWLKCKSPQAMCLRAST